MSRYRPPQPRASAYITQIGYERLRQELKALWPHRDEVTQALAAAAAEGDRSENAEYIYRKKQLREIDRRLRYLQKRLPDLNVVTQVGDASKIFFGAWVTLEKENGERMCYRIVGPDEWDSHPQYISMDAPLARALMKKSVDDEVLVHLAARTDEYLICAIDYTQDQDPSTCVD